MVPNVLSQFLAIRMKNVFITTGLLIANGVLVGCYTNPTNVDGETLTITAVEDGQKLLLDKNLWTEKFTCRHHGGEKSYEFAFSIYQFKYNDLSVLILPDLTYYSGVLTREGLDWDFDWYEDQRHYSIVIEPDGAAFYYDWSLAGSDRKMSVSRGYTCK